MARSRNIKPSFFSNEVLADAEPLARLLFIGLWTIADREGRLEYRPKKIKVEVLPYDDCNIEKLVSQLVKGGFITLYEVENINYIQVVNFKKHQNPHMKEQASTIPAPDLHGAKLVQAQPLTDSLNLIPDSPIPLPSKTAAPFFNFEEFWETYPRDQANGSKQEAEKKYKAAINRGATHAEIMLGLSRYVRYCQAGNFNKHASTWLNQQGWKEEWQIGKGNNYGNKHQNGGASTLDKTINTFELAKQMLDREAAMDAGDMGLSGWQDEAKAGRVLSGQSSFTDGDDQTLALPFSPDSDNA